MAAGIVYALIELIVLLMRGRRKPKIKLWREAAKLALFLSAALLLMVTVRPSFAIPAGGMAWRSVSYNLTPFASIAEYLRYSVGGGLDTGVILRNLIGNIAMFMPLGFLAPAIWPWFRRFGRCLLLGALASVGIELAQLAFSALGMMYRSVDIDDVILNAAGTAAGYGLFGLVMLIVRKLKIKVSPASRGTDT